MELSDQEKERIAAEEKVRHEARKALHREEWGGCCGRGGHGWGHRGGFWKGLIVGLLLCAAFGMLRHHGKCGYGHGYMAGPGGCAQMAQPAPAVSPAPKK